MDLAGVDVGGEDVLVFLGVLAAEQAFQLALAQDDRGADDDAPSSPWTSRKMLSAICVRFASGVGGWGFGGSSARTLYVDNAAKPATATTAASKAPPNNQARRV